jgi:NodT family efflux transporter outer membrane factor (OMF) lipoprotein
MSPSNKARRAAAAAAVLGLGACATVGPDFQVPPAPQGLAAASYAMAGDRIAPEPRLDPDVRAAGPWWRAFGSAELNEVVRLALAGNPTLAEARARLDRYEADVRATRGANRLQATLQGSAGRERVNAQAFGFTEFPSPTIDMYSAGLGIRYDLDVFGGRRRAVESAQARARAAANQADAAYLMLSGAVVAQAIRIAGLRAQIASVEGVLEQDHQTLGVVGGARKAGGQPRSASTSATAQLAEDEALLPDLQRELDAARHQLALLAGQSPAGWTAPDFDLTRLVAPAEVPISLPSRLMRRRPDILAAEADLHAATADVGVAIAAQYPDLDLSGDFVQTALRPGGLFNYSASGWSLMHGLTAPLFNGGTLKAERQAAEAEVRAAQARYDQTVLRAFVQVSDLLSALAADRDRLAALARANAASVAAVDDAEAAYRLGGGAAIQLIDARRRLGRVRMSLAQAQAQHHLDLADLFTAAAADWRER